MSVAGHSPPGRASSRSGDVRYTRKAEVTSERHRDGPLPVDGARMDVIQAPKLEPRITRYERSGFEWIAVEPLPVDHPFRKLDNLVLTPHLGYVTEDSFRNHYRQMVEGIDAWFKGEAPRKLV